MPLLDSSSLDTSSKVAGMRAHSPAHDSSHFHTANATLRGAPCMMGLCCLLVHASQWFSVLPLPDDQWEVCVKKENEDLLHSWCAALQH